MSSKISQGTLLNVIDAIESLEILLKYSVTLAAGVDEPVGSAT